MPCLMYNIDAMLPRQSIGQRKWLIPLTVVASIPILSFLVAGLIHMFYRAK